MVEVRQQHHTWAPWLELDGAAIPLNSAIRKFQKEHTQYLAEALEQPLLLPKDMAALRHVRQPDLFMSMKRDLALVSFPACLTEGVFSLFPFLSFFLFFIFLFFIIFLTYSLVVYMQAI